MNATAEPLIGGWVNNGAINPLIRSEEQLRDVAGAEFLEAVRWAAIHMNVYKRPGLPPRLNDIMSQGGTWDPNPEEVTATLRAYFDDRKKPDWKRRDPVLPDIWTPAQFLARHGSQQCSSICYDFADLAQCFRLTRDYNDFDSRVCLDGFRRFNLSVYYNRDNPNNGSDLYRYFYGWEGSLAVYAEFHGEHAQVITALNPVCVAPWTRADFKASAQALGKSVHADECYLAKETSSRLIWRFWWD